MIWRLLFAALLAGHLLLLPRLSSHLRERPVAVKLGYLPHPLVLRATTADHTLLAAEAAVVRVLFYFGTLVEKFNENVIVQPELPNMYLTLRTALDLDPRNQDAYYFAQAAFTWEVGWVRQVNDLLERALRYRPWDAQIPFFLGFNHAYFLKEYERAAAYMQQAAEVSGNNLYATLASRFFYEARQTEMGLIFLDRMIATSKDRAIRESYQLRRAALLAVLELEHAVELFRRRTGENPKTIEQLLDHHILERLPVDPYGGVFYLDHEGRVRTTSKLAKPGS